MLRTALVSLGLIGLAYLVASQLTEGFAVWTAEGARRLAVIEQPVHVPITQIIGPRLTGRSESDRLGGMLIATDRVTIVDFIYTRCPNVCLTLGSGLQQIQQALTVGAVDDVRLLSISFDPAHDGVAELAQQASVWRADPRRWRFVTVPDAQQLKRLLDAFQVTVIADGQGGYDHNAALLVIDAHGRLVRIFDADEPDEALGFARSLLRRGPVT